MTDEVKDQHRQDIPQSTISDQASETKPIEESQQQINWKKFRDARDIERKERDAAQRLAVQKEQEAQALKQAMEVLLNKTPDAPKYEDDDDIRIQKKVDQAISERERKFEKQRAEREHAETPQRLRQTYNDFGTVCTPDNLDYLEYHYPEVAKAFSAMPEGFDKWSSVYQACKRFIPNNSHKDQVRMEKNINKPQSMSVGGATSTGDGVPQKIDDKRRSDNWARMKRIMKGA